MELVHTLPEDSQINSIVDYYSSYLLCSKSPNQDVLLYESDLNIMSRVQNTHSQLSLFSLKNRIVCGYSDGAMDLCILR